jgi:nitroimidazol reductase NimA-like FMN-containing flavoprotein (pyridoxamine 5'-phosphate oxidase superfamily)
MEKSFNTIKDINKIEEELKSQYAGVLALNTNEERLIQVPCTFLYYHKNIFAALEQNDDLIEKLVYDHQVSFTVLRNELNDKQNERETKSTYKIFSVVLYGNIKRPEDIKISDEIKELYNSKYSNEKLSDDNDLPVHFVMLDTVEIKACEEVGG